MRPGVFAKAAREGLTFPDDWESKGSKYLSVPGNRAWSDTGAEFFPQSRVTAAPFMVQFHNNADQRLLAETKANPPSFLEQMFNHSGLVEKAKGRLEDLTREGITDFQNRVLAIGKMRDIVRSPASLEDTRDDRDVRGAFSQVLTFPKGDVTGGHPDSWKGKVEVTGQPLNPLGFPNLLGAYDSVLPGSYKGIMSKSNEEFRKFLESLPPTPVYPVRKSDDLDTLG